MAHPLVVNIATHNYDVYVARPSKWGNPFTHYESVSRRPGTIWVQTRDDAINAYRLWLPTQPDLIADLHELKGKILGCHCAPLPCHADYLANLAKWA